MGIFDGLFDKRSKMDYTDGCVYIFDIVWNHKLNFSPTNILEVEYRLDLVSFIASYLDTQPQPKSVRVASTFGKDCINYGTVHAPKEFKDKFLNKCKERHSYFKNILSSKFNNNIDLSSCEIIATEICNLNDIETNQNNLTAIKQDIIYLMQSVIETLNTYKLI